MRMTIEGVNPPVRKTTGSCGYDISCPQDLQIFYNEWISIDLGILMEPGDIPEGYCALIVPRSSSKVILRNVVGVIDSDYTMDTIKARIKAIDSTFPRFIAKNDRILQMIIVPFGIIESEQPPREKRTGGIGSTGVA